MFVGLNHVIGSRTLLLMRGDVSLLVIGVFLAFSGQPFLLIQSKISQTVQSTVHSLDAKLLTMN